MKCETAQQVFSDYLEETIERPLALTFEHHLRQCEKCQRAYADFRSTWRVLETTFSPVGPPVGFRASVLARVHAQQETAPQAAPVRRWSLRNVFGATVPVRSFAWGLTLLIFAVLLVRVWVTPGVFQSSLTGPLSVFAAPKDPGMETSIRAQVAGTDVDLYEFSLRPGDGASQVDGRVCRVDTGKEKCNMKLKSDGTPLNVVVPRRQGMPTGVHLTWSYEGQKHAKHIYLPRSLRTSGSPYFPAWKGDARQALRQIATEYGVVIIDNAEVKGSVSISGEYENAEAALEHVAGELGLQVRNEGPRAYAVYR